MAWHQKPGNINGGGGGIGGRHKRAGASAWRDGGGRRGI
jgi:hypothetical protein